MNHSRLWLAAILAAVAACAPRTCITPEPTIDLSAAQGLTAGTPYALVDTVNGAPMIDGIPECEAR